MAKKPKLQIQCKQLSKPTPNSFEFEFIAKVDNPDTLEFYSWDFNLKRDIKDKPLFKATVLKDVNGIQKRTLTKGTYQVACRALDKSGLKSIEILKIRINGKIKIN